MVKAGVNHRQNQQRQHGGKGEAEHDHHRHTLEKTSRSSGAAKYGGEGGQQDRPQTRGCRINSLSLIFLLFCCSISSTSTMPLRISIPLRLSKPIKAIKPKGCR